MFKDFMCKLREDNEIFTLHITGHGVKILFTMVYLKLIYTIGDLIFSERPKMLHYMEFLSEFVLFALFFILVLFDFYDLYIQKKNENKGVL